MDGFKTGFFWIVTSWEILIFFVLIQWKNMPECQFLIWHKFCFSLNSNYSIWILEFKEAEKNRRQEEDVSKPPFVPPLPQTHESALANSAFSSVVIGIGILVNYYFHAIVGTFFAGPSGDVFFPEKTQSLHLIMGCSPLFPRKGGFAHFFACFLWILITAACEGFGPFCWLRFWKWWKLLLSAGSGASCCLGGPSYEVSGSSVQWELGSCSQNEQPSAAAAVLLAAFI